MGGGALTSEARRRTLLLAGVELRGHPHPGQHYKHGWIPIAGDAIPGRVHLAAGAHSDPSSWRAERTEGLSGNQAQILAAITSYVRQPGFVNTRLRTPTADRDPKKWKTWLHEPSMDELLGWKPFDEAAEQKAQARADKMIAALDKAMEQSRTTAPMTVFRGASPADIGIPSSGSAVGHEWTDPGFASTSVSRSVAAGSFGGPSRAVLAIHVPPGTPALTIDGLGEDEALLGRGLRYRVVADHGNGQLDVEIVPPSTAT